MLWLLCCAVVRAEGDIHHALHFEGYRIGIGASVNHNSLFCRRHSEDTSLRRVDNSREVTNSVHSHVRDGKGIGNLLDDN